MKASRKFAAAFTQANDDRWLPPKFVIGELEIRHVRALDYDQHFVDGVGVDETTLLPIPDPKPEIIRTLKRLSSKWARQDETLARKRARKDGSFREMGGDKDSEVRLVRVDRGDAFSAFCKAMADENHRLTAGRRAEVATVLKMTGRRPR